MRIDEVFTLSLSKGIRDGYKIKYVNALFSSSADTLVCESSCGIEEAQTRVSVLPMKRKRAFIFSSSLIQTQYAEGPF
jgi:hypothetical protein